MKITYNMYYQSILLNMYYDVCRFTWLVMHVIRLEYRTTTITQKI